MKKLLNILILDIRYVKLGDASLRNRFQTWPVFFFRKFHQRNFKAIHVQRFVFSLRFSKTQNSNKKTKKKTGIDVFQIKRLRQGKVVNSWFWMKNQYRCAEGNFLFLKFSKYSNEKQKISPSEWVSECFGQMKGLVLCSKMFKELK